MEKLFKVLRLSRSNLIEFILSEFSNETVITDNHHYICIMRDKKYPTIVCHIDTVHSDESPLFEKRPIIVNNGIITSPAGLGADDRAGVYFLIEYASKYNVNLLFCNYEECGGIGVSQFIIDYPDLLSETPYFLEYDRANMDEFVTYIDNEPEFDTILSKYYNQAIGSYSDIYNLSEHYQIASANISIGYKYQHTTREFLNPEIFQKNDELLNKLLTDLGNKQYRIEDRYSRWYDYDLGLYNDDYIIVGNWEVYRISKDEIIAFNYKSKKSIMTDIKTFIKNKRLPKALIEELKKWI